jgi:uncharacterized protein YdeI (YjbR/CyaY-like superfamily)
MSTAIPKTETYYAKDRKAWRKWLEKNHLSCAGIWLIYFKKDSGKTRVPYADAVEEALCFGWIDSTLNPIDEHCYMQLFMPRKEKSGWSKLNKERVARLEQEGLMTPAGLEKVRIAKTQGHWEQLDHIESFTLPEELEQAFKRNKKARAFFEGLSKTNKKYILYHVNNAKLPATRKLRVDAIIAAANEGRMLDRFIVKKNK